MYCFYSYLTFFKQLHLYQMKLSKGNRGNTNSPQGYLIRFERQTCTALCWFHSADLFQGLLPPGTPSPERLGRERTSGKRLPGTAWLLTKDAEVLLPQHPLPACAHRGHHLLGGHRCGRKAKQKRQGDSMSLVPRFSLINGASKTSMPPNQRGGKKMNI